jgi:hypothetical protein
LRSAQRGGAELALARANAELEHARGELARAEAALAAELAARPDAPADGIGAIGALELQRAAAFSQRHAHAARVLREQVQRACARVAELAAAADAAQAGLAQAHAGERVIERDRERFESAQRRARDHAEQHELEEHAERSRNDRGR